MNRPDPTTRRSAHRHAAVATLVLMISAVVATFASAGVASAAPPLHLIATPNPVTIPWGQTVGSYDLDWSTGSNLPAEFTYSINGAPESQRLDQTPADTAGPFAINFGETWTWRLYTKGLRRPLATVTITTRHPDKSCEGQCIKLVEITPHGTYADVHAILTSQMKALEITAHESGEPVSSAMFGGNTNNWNTKLLSLDPGTTYEFDLTATDESGNKQTWSGTFTTLRRQVSVTFQKIAVIDDSDDLSQGDLTFWFNTNHNWDGAKYGEIGVSSGETVHPNRTIVVADAPDSLTLGVFGRDDDCDFFDGLCVEGTGPWGGGSGSSSESDWATAWTSVLTAMPGPGEAFSDTFTMSTTGNALEFSVKGHYSVAYV